MGRRLAAALTVLGISVLVFGPLQGGIAISAVGLGFVERLTDARFTASELEELARLECFEDSLASIPDGSDARMNPIEDPYLLLRLTEAAYPRIRPVSGEAPYEFYVDVEPPSSAVVVDRTECGDTTIWVTGIG